MDSNASENINSIFPESVPEIITKTGGTDFYNRWLYEHHGFTTVYEPLEMIRNAVSDVLTANTYKYEHLYDTTVLEYQLDRSNTETVIEKHSGTDTTTEDNSASVTPTGTERTTHATTTPTRDTQFATTYDSTTERETGRNETSFNTYDEQSYNGRVTNSTEDKNKSLAYGHTVERERVFLDKPQDIIAREREIATFSLQMIIINDILDAIAIPVYIDYNNHVQPY